LKPVSVAFFGPPIIKFTGLIPAILNHRDWRILLGWSVAIFMSVLSWFLNFRELKKLQSKARGLNTQDGGRMEHP